MNKENIATIDLEKYRTGDRKIKSRVFTGRDRGEEVRKSSHLDDYYDHSDKVIILIPDDIFSITPSFLEEFLNNIVLKDGRDKCLSKIEFQGKYNIKGALEEAIERILQKKTGLQK